MSRTPTTPFIPPLLSPHPSPQAQPSPVIPGYTPAHAPGNYPVYPAHSPYTASPFIPPSPSGLANGLPPSNSRQGHKPGGISADYTGYPQGNPFTPSMASPAQMQTPYPPSLISGWQSAPGGYATFAQPGGAPWPQAVPFNSPYMPQTARMPPPGNFTPYTPYGGAPLPGGPGPGPAWNVPPSQQQGYFPPPPPMDPNNMWHGQPPPPMGPYGQRIPPEPPAQVYDRMDPFTPGNHYGPVLDPFLIKVVKAPVRLHPLISPPPDDGPDQPYLKWNMLFPTSTVQRSDDPPHISWANGREAPATFPRLTSLRLVSTYFPWMVEVKAKDKDRGVTCGEVIDAIGYDLGKLSYKQDFQNLTQREQIEVGQAYRHNRSPHRDVPGGSLGNGMKRLDFLRNHTMFAGIEVNGRLVMRLCGSELPCVFVLRCAERYMSAKDVQEQEARLRNATAPSAHSSSRSASRNAGPRSRANSTNARITVQPPSSTSTYDGDSSDDGGVDR